MLCNLTEIRWPLIATCECGSCSVQAERDYDLNRAAELKYGTLVSLQAQLHKVEDELAAKSSSGGGMLREEVTEDDISEVISR